MVKSFHRSIVLIRPPLDQSEYGMNIWHIYKNIYIKYIKAYIIYASKRGPWRLNPKSFFLWIKGRWKPAARQALRYGWYGDNSGWWTEAWSNVPKQWTQIASTLHKNMLTRSMLNWFYISLNKLYLAIVSQKGLFRNKVICTLRYWWSDV